VGEKTINDSDFDLDISVSSGLTPKLTKVEGNISLSGTTVRINGIGHVVIKVNQAGNDDFAPAPEKIISFCVNPLKPTASITKLDPVTLTSDNASNYQWLKNGVAIANAVDQDFIPTDAGLYTVKVTVNNCSSESNVVSVIFTAVEEPKSQSIWPNPASQWLTIGNPTDDIRQVDVYDLMGTMIMSSKVHSDYTIDVSSWTAGTYIFRLNMNEHQKVERIIVIR
jgi:hypothetical protein